MQIALLAAENGAVPGAKVGGLGDVVAQLPPALAAQGHCVDVLMPGYGLFSRRPGAVYWGAVAAPFAGREEPVTVYQLEGTWEAVEARLWVLEHPLFARPVPGVLYWDDGPERPFATDATRFALFCAAACQALAEGLAGVPEVIHLHDWHAATAAALVRLRPSLAPLARCGLVYTIHNLAVQGIRPLAGDPSSLAAWFPDLPVRPELLDPRHPHCYNPVRAALEFCHRIATVSPSYAREIQQPGDPERGYHGGEGLEEILARRAAEGALHGILNGCPYPSPPSPAADLGALWALAESAAERWLGREPERAACHLLALRRIAVLARRGGLDLLTTVGRVTPQKLELLATPLGDGRSCLDHLLARLPEDCAYVLLGSGDASLEAHFLRAAGEHRNFLFLRGFDEDLAEALYALGRLFLMPSTFEPCGIAQMLAMRRGQPCLVHAVGGLADTVRDGVDGLRLPWGGSDGAGPRLSGAPRGGPGGDPSPAGPLPGHAGGSARAALHLGRRRAAPPGAALPPGGPQRR
ncbi:MAG: glycogen synthase [Porticoccaceae bacterium]|nr:MAG: glycogen synthase [Porticoccaceae bacterium]